MFSQINPGVLCLLRVMRFCLPVLLLSAVSLSGETHPGPLDAEAPIIVPKEAAPVALPDSIRKTVEELGLKVGGVPVFHDKRNILELSYYGGRRGVPYSRKSSVLIEKGLKRFWIANRSPHPDPTTILGPFKGNALEELEVRKFLEEGLRNRNYSTHMQAISGLLKSEDYDLTRLGLQLIPTAMGQSPRDVESFMHFLKRSFPSQIEAFAKMGLSREMTHALQSMEQARERIKAVTVQPPARIYQPGYDPAIEQRNGIGHLPEEAWGEVKNGLQAAITPPPELKLNQKYRVYFVFRNVSEKVLRVSFPEISGGLRLTPEATPRLTFGGSEGVGGLRRKLTHWSLAPGHQAMVVCRDIQLMQKGAFVPKYASQDFTPGKITTWSSCYSRDEWEYSPDREPRLVAVPEGEWQGYLQTGKRSFILLNREVPYVPRAPVELGGDHGLKAVAHFPENLDYHRSEAIELRPGVLLYLNNKADAHWVIDHDSHRTTLSWGPISAGRLLKLGLVDLVEKNTITLLASPPPQRGAWPRLASLVQKARPLAEVALRLASRVDVREENGPDYAFLIRTIRDRRVALNELGLEMEVEEALKVLGKSEPSLPPKDQFTVVSDRELPPDFGETAWGPENDGLRAAALLPARLKDGATANVRIFIQNTSDQDIFLTVSNRGGYDYAVVADTEGDDLDVDRPYIYPTFFSSVLVPEVNPGEIACNPPLATLTKLRLQSGTVYELQTRTSLTYQAKKNASSIRSIGSGPVGTAAHPAESIITSPPMEALVTWRLHTLNGVQYSKDLKSRTWPAKGGWSGILETAPSKISLLTVSKK